RWEHGDDRGRACDGTQVGITEYLSKDVPGFRGILKHRYSDFIVNEVDLRVKQFDFVRPSFPN
ncbi:Pseudouridine synthase YOR243C, partial [Caligus rogercresseyi]